MHAALRSTKISAGVCDFLDQPTLARLAAHAARSRNARWMPYGKSTGFRNYMLLHPLSPEVAAKFRSPNHWLQAIAVHSPPPFDPLPPLFPKLQAIKGTCPTPDDIALFNWSNGPSLRQLQIGPFDFKGDLVPQTLIDFVSYMETIYPNMKPFALDAFIKNIQTR